MCKKCDIPTCSRVERGIIKISLDLLGAISSVLYCNVAALVSESAVNSAGYMESEIIEELRKLDNKKRKYILDVIRLTNESF